MQDTKSEGGLWAVVYLSGGKKLIGKVHTLDLFGEVTERDEMVAITSAAAEGVPLRVTPAYEFITAALPFADRATGKEGMKRFVQVMPIDNCIHPGNVVVRVEGLHFFHDMDKGDAKNHSDLVEAVEKQMVAVRAQQVGIIPATGFDTGGRFG